MEPSLDEYTTWLIATRVAESILEENEQKDSDVACPPPFYFFHYVPYYPYCAPASYGYGPLPPIFMGPCYPSQPSYVEPCY